MIETLLFIVLKLLRIYLWIVIASVLASWLVAFQILNTRNKFIRATLQFLDALTDPVFKPLRHILPTVAGLDFSPLIVMLGIALLERLILSYLLG